MAVSTGHEPYAVVRAADGSFGVWPAGRAIPAGWRPLGTRGTRAECLAEIDRMPATRAPRSPSAGRGAATELFAAGVARFPGRFAVSEDGDSRLTYAELDARSDAIARDLAARGLGRGDQVAFQLDRGVAMLAVLLGILKAGAAYVPVDRRYPAARRDLMLTASFARALVTGAGPDLEVTMLDPGPHDAGDAAACVLFTSGSAGTPKAVVLDHGNLVHLATNPALPALAPGDRVGQVSSPSFDAFHYEVWCALAGGAEIVVLPALPDMLGGDIARTLRRRRITAMLVPSAAVNQVVQEDRDAFADLRTLHTGGDVVSPAACRALLGGAFGGAFFNLYGPTEATTACTAHRITCEDAAAGHVPIGRPLDGTTVHVLDDDLAEVGPGAVGQVHVGGPGVARGYLGRPALTADRFLPDPSGPPGSRMYATGDRARRRPDGVLEFVGRADDQVKIRGYRVEPGEVEQALHRCPEVRDAAVLVFGAGDAKHLVAVVGTTEEIAPRALRARIARDLPEFLVPSSLVLVDSLPVTAHGKRDLVALRALATGHLRRAERRVPPADDVERCLVEVWEDVLAVEHIGVTDDFFEIGGHSLLAFRALRRISRELSIELEPRDVLVNSELRGLAALIRSRKAVARS